MRPRPDEVLSSVAATIREHIAPEVTTEFGQSLLRTIDYLLDQTRLRILHEGAAMHAGLGELRSALAAVGDLARGRADMGDLVAVVEAALTSEDPPAGAYPTVVWLADEQARLREALDLALAALLDRRHDLAGDPAYTAVRDEIRSCLAAQLQRESAWIMTGDLEQRR